MEQIADYDAASRPFVSSTKKPLPAAPAKDVALYPHLEVWPPSPSESTLTGEHSHGRRGSSQASTIFNEHEPSHHGRATSFDQGRVRGDDIV